MRVRDEGSRRWVPAFSGSIELEISFNSLDSKPEITMRRNAPQAAAAAAYSRGRVGGEAKPHGSVIGNSLETYMGKGRNSGQRSEVAWQVIEKLLGRRLVQGERGGVRGGLVES